MKPSSFIRLAAMEVNRKIKAGTFERRGRTKKEIQDLEMLMDNIRFGVSYMAPVAYEGEEFSIYYGVRNSFTFRGGFREYGHSLLATENVFPHYDIDTLHNLQCI